MSLEIFILTLVPAQLSKNSIREGSWSWGLADGSICLSIFSMPAACIDTTGMGGYGVPSKQC